MSARPAAKPSAYVVTLADPNIISGTSEANSFKDPTRLQKAEVEDDWDIDYAVERVKPHEVGPASTLRHVWRWHGADEKMPCPPGSAKQAQDPGEDGGSRRRGPCDKSPSARRAPVDFGLAPQLINSLRPGKKLLVLDLDACLVDTRPLVDGRLPAEECARPGLHAFLKTACVALRRICYQRRRMT